MRRMIVAGIILIVIALSSWWEQNCIIDICTDMKEKISVTEELLQKGDYEKAEENTKSVKNYWKDKGNVLDVIIRHDDTDDITLDIAVLERYISLQDKTLALSVLDELAGHFDEIRGKTKIHYTNIF